MINVSCKDQKDEQETTEEREQRNKVVYLEKEVEDAKKSKVAFVKVRRNF